MTPAKRYKDLLEAYHIVVHELGWEGKLKSILDEMNILWPKMNTAEHTQMLAYAKKLYDEKIK